MEKMIPWSLRRLISPCTLALAGVSLTTLAIAQVTWDADDTDGASGDGVYWHDDGNWIGESLPGTGSYIYLDGEDVVVDASATYYMVSGGSGGSITIEAGGTLATYGSYSAVRNLSGLSVGAGGLLLDANDDIGSLRSPTSAETGGRIEGYTQARDNTITLNGGSFAPLGTDISNYRKFSINGGGEFDLNTGLLELDVFDDDDVEYLDVISGSGELNLSHADGGTILLVPRNSYEPAVGHSYDLWDNSGSGTVTAGDASNVQIDGYLAIWDTNAWASSGVLTIDSFASGAQVIYSSDMETDQAGSTFFYSNPASLDHDAYASHVGTEDGAMVFGYEGASWENLVLRFPVEEGESYEVVVRSALMGSGSNTDDHYVKLIESDGTTIESSGDIGTGDHQVVLPASGGAPANAAYIQINWLLRGVVGSGQTRHIEIYQVEVIKLGAEGPRPFNERDPYINHRLGYVNETVTVDMTDSFSGTVTNFTNDAGIPMTTSGSEITFAPTTTRTHSPLKVFAENSAGVSVEGATVYLQVDAEPATLASNTGLDTAVHAQVNHQYVEPDQYLFPVDCDILFTGGLPPFEYEITSAPAWVEMPVNGLVGGKCPSAATPTSTTVVIQATDARDDTATYTLDLDVIATRSRTPTHTPADSAAFQSALATGGNVIQLQTGVSYSMGNMYGKALTTSSTASPVIILGTSGAEITNAGFNNSGHFHFEGVHFRLPSDGTLVSAKKVRGVRFVDCTFEGVEIAVDLEDGTPWVKDDEFRYAGNGIAARENTYLIMEGCHFEKFNTSFSASVSTRSFGVFDSVSETVADDHCFFQQSSAIWLENVDFLGHAGNHTTGEHRDIIQLANPNQPPNRHVLLRRVFGYGDGQSQACFIENEDQRIGSSRIPYWLGNHRDLLIEHCVFIGNSQHGISMRGNQGYEVRNSATIGHPDETYQDDGYTAAFGHFYLRQYNQNGLFINNICDKLSKESADETDNTNHTFTNMLVLDDLSGGYATNRTAIFPDFNDDTLTMKERFTMDSTWATNNPTLGPDILRP